MAKKKSEKNKPKTIKPHKSKTISVDYERLFSCLPGLYLILSPDLTILEASEAYLAATYSKINDIKGKNIFEAFPDDTSNTEATGVSNLNMSLSYVLKNKKQHVMATQRYDVLQANGDFFRKYWKPLNRPVLNKDGEVELIIHTVEDVTDYELSKENYQKHEEENSKLLKELTELRYFIDQFAIIVVTDPKGVIQKVNDNFCRTSQYQRSELIGNNMRIVNSGYHPKSFFVEFWKTITAGKVWRGEIKNRAKDGSEYWVDTTIMPFLNEFGKPYKFMAVRYDITERKKAEYLLKKSEEALRQNEEDLNFALDTAGIGSWSFDLRTQITARSLRHDMIFGYKEIQQNWDYDMFLNKHVHPDDRERIDKSFLDAVTSGKDWAYECRIIRADGKEGYIWAKGKAFNDENNEPVFLMGFVGDITELKQKERDILRKSEELEQTNKELDSFSYSVSHDLRAPLRAINGYARILDEDYEDKLDDEAKRIINIITSNAKRMGVLIDDLLSFSRLGKQDIIKVNVDMNSLVNSVAREQVNTYFDKSFDIEIKPMENAKGDSSMIYLVVTNLVSNALKYSSKRESPKIEIGSRREKEENVFYIKDNGAGFDMKYYDKLFGVFQRLHGQAEFEGTGVGLAIVQRVISKHGGRIWAEGKVGEGAVFYFSLPVN